MDHYRVVAYYGVYIEELGNCIFHWMNTPWENTRDASPHLQWHP